MIENTKRRAARVQWVVGTLAVAAAAAVGVWHGQSRARADVRQLSQHAPAATKPAAGPTDAQRVAADSPEAAGQYLIKVGGCNDCHTAGFAMAGGNLPESEWLLGGAPGFRGPWGTTYAPNLRLFVASMSEGDFVQIVRQRNTRPPMPWWALHAMGDDDLRAVYRYIKSLGAPGKPGPEYVPPGEEPVAPYFDFTPKFPKKAE